MILAEGIKQQVKIGALDRKISVRAESTSSTNALGEVTGVTNTDTSVWAHVMNDDRVTGEENDLNDKQSVIEMRTFVIRYQTLTYSNKIVYDSNVFDIMGIEELGRRQFLKVKTKRVV